MVINNILRGVNFGRWDNARDHIRGTYLKGEKRLPCLPLVMRVLMPQNLGRCRESHAGGMRFDSSEVKVEQDITGRRHGFVQDG